MKASMVRTISALLDATKDEMDTVHPEQLTYTKLVEALNSAEVGERDILKDLRDVVLVDLAMGTHRILDDGGPFHSDKTLRYEGPMAAVKLFRSIVQAVKELDDEDERLKGELVQPIEGGVVFEGEPDA